MSFSFNNVNGGNLKLKFMFTADITSIAKVYGKAVQRNGDTYMDIEKMTIDFTMKNARFKVKDNVNSQNVLGKMSNFGSYFCQTKTKRIYFCSGEAINQFLNTNANELVKEMRPAASQSIAKLFKNILNQAFSRIPMSQWLLD